MIIMEILSYLSMLTHLPIPLADLLKAKMEKR